MITFDAGWRQAVVVSAIGTRTRAQGMQRLGRARGRLLLLAVLAATALGTMPDRTAAAHVDWISGYRGKWNTAADWSGGKSPTSANNES